MAFINGYQYTTETEAIIARQQTLTPIIQSTNPKYL
jgi:hypothetical protein